MDIIGVVEILILIAIGIEVFALFKHSKLENKMEEHIQATCDRLLRADEKMKVLDTHVERFDEHLIRLDEHMSKLDEYISALNEHLIRYDERRTRNH
ncbi:MAG: hypothetical protein JSV35_01125 [Candidatus Bathyarchaeota archaeon]|nr:MAG: hypothetical protein JSV35_01125 [Candidatus Bathyarchaeota archaeon]